jgi:hypothetical protein
MDTRWKSFWGWKEGGRCIEEIIRRLLDVVWLIIVETILSLVVYIRVSHILLFGAGELA